MSNIAALPTAELGGQLPAQNFSSQGLMNDFSLIEKMQAFANMMAGAVVSVPMHFRGKPGDCLAVVMQATQWGMNPYAVAQKTHITQGGALGYEAQLVNAVVTNSRVVEGRPEYEFIGDWHKILGKVQERQSEKGGKYYVAAWDKKDEEGLGVTIRWTLRGEPQPRTMTIMMSQAYPRFSTQWATDPQQQISYLITRKFARRYCPDVLLGVYTPEELSAQEIDMGVAEVVTDTPPAAPANTKTEALKNKLGAGKKAPAVTLEQVLSAISAATTPEQISDAGKLAAKLSDDDKVKAGEAYKARIHELKTQNEQRDPQDDQLRHVEQKGPGIPADDVERQLRAAKTLDAVDTAGDLIGEVPDPGQRARLGELYREIRAELSGE